MFKKFGLPALVMGAVLTLISPVAALAQHQGGGHGSSGGGHGYSGGGRSYSGGGRSFGGSPGIFGWGWLFQLRPQLLRW